MSNVIEFLIQAKDNFSASLDKLNGQLGSLERAYRAVAAAAAVYGLTEIIKHSLDTAEAMGFAAQKANMSTESFSAMAFAAKQSNVDMDALSMAFKGLHRAMAEGDTTPAGRQLQLLGITTKDSKEAMLQLADAFAKSADSAAKSKIATELFTRSGSGMIPFLLTGRAAIEDLMKTAQALGMVITDDMAASANQVNDNLQMMGAVMQGTVNVAMKELSPAIEQFTGQYILWAEETDSVNEKGRILIAGLKLLASAALFVMEPFNVLGHVIGGTIAAIVFAIKGDWTAALAVLNEKVDSTAKYIAAVWDEGAQSIAAGEAKKMKALRATGEEMQLYNQHMADNEKELEKFIQAVEEFTDKTYAQIVTFGLSAEQQKIYELQLKQTKMAQLGLADATAKSNIEQAQANIFAKDALERHKTAIDELFRSIDAGRTTYEKHIAALEDIGRLRKDMGDDKSVDEMQQREIIDWNKIAEAMYATPYDQHIIKLKEIEEARKFLSSDKVDQALQQEIMNWNKSADAMDQYKQTAQDVGEVLRSSLSEQLYALGSEAFQLGTSLAHLMVSMTQSVSQSLATALVQGKSLFDALTNAAKTALASVLAMLIQIGLQRLILWALDMGATKTENSAKLAAGMSEVYTNSFASAASIPEIGWIIAPAIAAGNLAVAAGGAVAAQGVGAAIGIAHGGLDYVPSEATYLLDRGERVLSPRQNQDLTSFLGGGGGGVVIGSLVMHIMENATSADQFARMSRVELRNALGQPVVDALNEMFKIGVRPTFASQIK